MNKPPDVTNDLHISPNEDIFIRTQLNLHKVITLDMLDSIIKEYQNDILIENKKYLNQMDHIHFGQGIKEKNNSNSSPNSPQISPRLSDDINPRLSDDHPIYKYDTIFHDQIKGLTDNHNQLINKINEDLLLMYKFRKIYIEIHPESVRLPPAKPSMSPRQKLSEQFKNSPLRKSFDRLIK